MRRVYAPVVALLATLLLGPAAASASPWVQRVVGGTTASTTTDAPWQALVLPSGYLCGGSILDETHVVTAAHCVYDEDTGAIVSPTQVAVRAGITSRYSAGQHPTVVGVTIDPDYNPYASTDDAAILTLASPGFTLNGTTVAAIPLTDPSLPALGPTTDLRLSGWGSTAARAPADTNIGSASTDLQVADHLHPTSACASVYAPFDGDRLLCAGQADLDACQGDSGGPLAVQVAGVWELAGIVTGGAGCAWPGYPGFYARVGNQQIHAFLTQRGVGYTVADPANVAPPALVGTPTPGNRLTCDLGRWTDALGYDVEFRADGVLVATGTTALTVTAPLVGRAVVCTVTAYGLTGSAEATSAPVTITAPAVAPTPTPVATVTPPPASVTTPPADTVAPKAKVLRTRCTRTICRLDVTAIDPRPSAGLRTIAGTVATRVKRHTTTQKLKTTSIGPGVFRLTTPKLHKGKHTFALIATDLSGNRQVAPTRLSKTTRY